MATTTFASDRIALLIVDLYERLLERTTCRTCMLRFTATVSEFRSRTFERQEIERFTNNAQEIPMNQSMSIKVSIQPGVSTVFTIHRGKRRSYAHS
jgi:hemolysin activation/secretion protein